VPSFADIAQRTRAFCLSVSLSYSFVISFLLTFHFHAFSLLNIFLASGASSHAFFNTEVITFGFVSAKIAKAPTHHVDAQAIVANQAQTTQALTYCHV
jgi:hypothetical protein